MITPPTAPPLPNEPESRTSDGTIKDASAPPEPAKPELPVVPDTYTFTAPDGVTLDDAAIARVTPVFKELGLPQESAQKIVNAYNAELKSVETSILKHVEDTRAGWREAVMNDPMMAGKLDTIKADLGRAKDLMPLDVRLAFNEGMTLTGAGDHPAIVKGFWILAKSMIEGKHVTAGGVSEAGQAPPNSAPKTVASRMYPNLPA